MKYLFPPSLEVDYTPLAQYIGEGEELGKDEIIGKCSGNIPFELLQMVKELEFDRIGKEKGKLYLR